jgi:ribose transport system substrate-binding protein
VKNGGAFADTGYSISALGWNEADVMLRLMLGQPPLVEAHKTPIKTFTSANLDGLDISQNGWLSGSWQTSDDFRAMYRKLWGARS